MPAAFPKIEAIPEKTSGSEETGFFRPTRAQMRVWGAKSVLSLVDQGLSSGAGFGVNVLLARWMSAGQYGAFAVAFSGYLFLSGFHNVLLLEPLSVIGPARHAANLGSYFRAQLGVHGILVGPLSALALIASVTLYRWGPNSALVGALLGGGLALPVLLLLWLARRMCYVLQRPSAAVAGSGLYLVFAVGALIALHAFGRVTPLTAFFSLGLGSLLGAALILRQIGFADRDDQPGASIPWSRALIENWTYGRWLVGSTILYAVATFTQTFFVAGVMGLGAAGILRATQVPSLVMTQIVAATSLLVLPALSYDFGRGRTTHLRRKAISVSFALGLAALAFTAFLALDDTRVERLLFNGKYAGYARLIPILALVPVLNGVCASYSMALRASQKTHYDLISNAFAAPVAVLSTIFFMRWWGLLGVAMSVVLSVAVMNVVTLFFFARFGTEAAIAAQQ